MADGSRAAGSWCRRGRASVARVIPCASPPLDAQHAPQNVMEDVDDIARFHDRCSDLMRELLDALSAVPDRPRSFREVEDAIGWPRRRIASVLGGVARLRHTEFGGRRPYHLQDDRRSASGRWEIWMDSRQARAVRGARAAEADLSCGRPADRRAGG
jgi:hypothetical protein